MKQGLPILAALFRVRDRLPKSTATTAQTKNGEARKGPAAIFNFI